MTSQHQASSIVSSTVVALDPHTDGISSVHFSPSSSSSSSLLVTSWDGAASVYSNPQSSSSSNIRFPHAAAVLCGAYSASGDRIYTGGVECAVRAFQPDDSSTQQQLGSHDAPVRCLNYCPATQCVLSGSWDKTARLWDERSGSSGEVGRVSLPDRVFAQDVGDDDQCLAVFGLGDKSVHAYDVRQLDSGPVFVRESSSSSLGGHQIRCLRLIEHGRGLLLGSIEGRVAVEHVDDASGSSSSKRYAFKCHRQDEWIFPVNAIASLKTGDGTVFATGGGDGTVSVWDAHLKKKLVQLPKLATSCAALDFAHHHDAATVQLAVAQSYAFERGELPSPAPADQLLVYELQL